MASKSPEAGRGMEQILPQCTQKAPTLLTPWSWTSSLQDCETMNFFTRLACFITWKSWPIIQVLRVTIWKARRAVSCTCQVFSKRSYQPFCKIRTLSFVFYLHNSTQHLPTPIFLPRESHGQRSLVGCCP